MAMGLIAGPDNPPVLLAKMGRFFLISIRIPVMVLIIVMPSAPPASTALAISVISLTLGDSLTYTGTLDTALTFSVKRLAISGFTPNATPPSLTLGQEIFNSIALTLGAVQTLLATATYSSSVAPAIFAMIGTSNCAR